MDKDHAKAMGRPNGFTRIETSIFLVIGLTVSGVFTQPSPTVAAPQADDSAVAPRALASQAIKDLVHNFWTGSETEGHYLGVCNGSFLSAQAVGCMWEQAQSYNALYGWWKLSGDPEAHNRLVANWNWIKQVHPPEHWGTCGWHTPANYASDDTGWDAALAMQAYDVTHDPAALDSAKLAVACAYHRWGDGPLMEGIWYSDDHKVKSLYQATLALDALRIYEQSHDKLFLSYAQGSYDWMEHTLRRHDGLYWCDANPSGPIGTEHPDDIRMAHSIVFLEGAMAMGLLHYKFYLLTGDVAYKEKAIDGARAIVTKLVDQQGILMDDRDAWVNGFFAEEWATQVLPLSPELWNEGNAILRRTALSIARNDRTPDGHYGGDWCGPVDPMKSAWGREGKGSTPMQPQTNANAVDIILAAYSMVSQK